MDKFWVGLKNKKIVCLVFLAIMFSFAGFLGDSAYAVSRSDCEKWGGTMRGRNRNDLKCQAQKSDGKWVDINKQSDLPNTVLSREEKGSCPSGYDARGLDSSQTFSLCVKKNSDDAKNRDKSVNNSLNKLTEDLKKSGKYKSMTDQDWNTAQGACKNLEGTGEALSCLEKQAEGKNNVSAANQAAAEEKKSDDKNSCAIEWVGWIVCPFARGTNGVVIGLYGLIQEHFLNIKSDKLFSTSSEGAKTYKVWEQFRDMANVFFVIMIAIIIFSQVTGMGISSYGVKKMLPKIIIYAVLVNISWYIVVIAVDASNIIGKTIFRWLSASEEWKYAAASASGESPIEKVLTGAITGSVIVAGVGLALIFGSTSLMFLVSAAVAIIMAVAILMVREAAVIVLVVLSPMAFVFGLLPNTESIFKRWAKLLKNMLMIYPICSFMIGGAIFVSNILYEVSDNALLKIVYGLLPIMALFAIVAVIKTVLSFVDGVTGGNISGAFNKIAGGANGAFQNSNAMKHLRDIESDRSIRGIAIGRNAKAAKYEEKKYQRNRKMLSKLQSKDNLSPSEFRMMSQKGAEVASFEKAQSDGMITAMATSIGSDVSNVSGELAKIANVKDPVQQGLMYGALSQAVTKSGLNASGQAAAMNSIAQSALSISDKDQRKAVAAQIASKAGSDFKKVNPAAAKAVMQDFSNPASLKSVAQMESDISTYSGASAKQMADWATMSSSNVNDNKAVQAMRSAFASGDQSKMSQAQNMGKIAEQALTANANGTMSLTPDQQKNFAAMQQLAAAHGGATTSQTATASTAAPAPASGSSSTQTRKQQTVKVAPSYNVVGVPQSSNIVSKGSASYNPGPALTAKPTPPASNASPSASSGATQAQNNASNPQTPWRRYN